MAEGGTAEGWTAYQQTEAQSARTFTLVGVVFYIVEAVVVAIFTASAWISFVSFGPSMPPGMVFFPFLFPAVFLGVAVGLTVWSWITLQKLEAGGYQEAQAPVLVLGILGLVFALLIGGVFLIIAYAKLSNVLSPRPQVAPMAAPPPVASPQAGGRVCPNCGRPIPMDAKFCNHCGHELP
ncbi:MAG: zinc ribbon domain-containing protein [Thermoplasmata archaeon]